MQYWYGLCWLCFLDCKQCVRLLVLCTRHTHTQLCLCNQDAEKIYIQFSRLSRASVGVWHFTHNLYAAIHFSIFTNILNQSSFDFESDFQLAMVEVQAVNGNTTRKYLIRPWLFVPVAIWSGTKLVPMPF